VRNGLLTSFVTHFSCSIYDRMLKGSRRHSAEWSHEEIADLEPLSSDTAAYIFDDSSAVAAPISEMLRAADAAQRLGRREAAEELIQMIFAALDEDSGAE
jgi:hypothetical protein